MADVQAQDPEHQDLVAKETPVDLDRVRQTIMDSQVDVSELTFPLIGWALLTFFVLDMVGNVLGIPVFSGMIICRENPSNAATVFGFILQAAGFAFAGSLLYKSRWRIWWRTMFMSARDDAWLRGAGEFAGGRFQSLFTKVTAQGKRLRDQAAKMAHDVKTKDMREGSQGGDAQPEEGTHDKGPVVPQKKALALKILAALTLLVAAGLLLYWRPGLILSAVMLGLIGIAVLVFSHAAATSSRLFWGRIKTHYGSLMGLYAGIGLVAVFMFLFGGKALLLYPKQAWIDGAYFPFRVLQLILLCGGLVVLQAQSKVSLKNYTFYRATRPSTGEPRTYHVFDFVKAAAWPAYLSFDPDELTKIVVLGRREDRHYEVIDHSRRLALMQQPYTVLNLNALQGKIGGDTTDIGDSGGFFSGQARYTIMARSFESLHGSLMASLGGILPERPMAVFLEDLFQSENPRLLLDRLLKRAVDLYVGEQGESASDLREKYTDVLTQARNAAMLHPNGLRPEQDLSSGDAGGLSLSIIGYEQLRAQRESLDAALGRPRQQWQFYRQKRLKAKRELPEVFRRVLRQHFVDAIGASKEGGEDADVLNETVDCLLACSGIEMEVERFDFAEGASMECENMVETIDREFTGSFAEIERQLRERESKLLEFFESRVQQIEAGKREVVAQLVQSAPQVLPFLLQNPVGERFIRFFLTLGESAMRDKLGHLQVLKADDPNLGKQVEALIAAGAGGDGNGSDEEEQQSQGSTPQF